MLRLIALCFVLSYVSPAFAKTIFVETIEELNAANASGKPGDVVILKNGTWKDVVIKLNCSGTENLPITFKAQTTGKVIISGVSQLRLGGNYIIVEGLLFTNGYSPSHEVIDFKINNKELANHCRITNCVINDFNKPKRMADDNWVSFSGKNNRVDHCSFINKKNMGVLLAVLLDDDRSRENFHSIDHNYFGLRLPLASNGGETIRVGLSQHCQFNSNTQIKENFFEHCDGEAEVISINSCANVVSGNLFKYCQGSVVLRHGNYNTVTNNIFLGNGKEGTGGVRIINKGQWVINNFFYKCRGESFRAPLVLMNGIPNSPANRYVQVTDAVVMNNTFVDCSPMSLCEGSDKERTLPPANALFAKNIFYNNADSNLYNAWDDISGIRFIENKISSHYSQNVADGFVKSPITTQKFDVISFPVAGKPSSVSGADSLLKLGGERAVIPNAIGFSDLGLIKKIVANAYSNCGAKWFVGGTTVFKSTIVSCKSVSEIYQVLSNLSRPVVINLTNTNYSFDKPIVIGGNVRITSPSKREIKFSSASTLPCLFMLKGKSNFSLTNLDIFLSGLGASSFIATDTSGSSEHYSFQMENVSAKGFGSCNYFFYASKSTLADSVLINNCSLSNLANGFSFADEKENKGYYNVEKIKITNSKFAGTNGILLNLYRGGSDESTLGPDLLFFNNVLSNCNTEKGGSLINLTGVQKSKVENNSFNNCNSSSSVISYKDSSRALHILRNNKIFHSGSVHKNSFVTGDKNVIQ
jgi:poly(beta-D-mannuronate) lyase